jgi:hypothetical protein
VGVKLSLGSLLRLDLRLVPSSFLPVYEVDFFEPVRVEIRAPVEFPEV